MWFPFFLLYISGSHEKSDAFSIGYRNDGVKMEKNIKLHLNCNITKLEGNFFLFGYEEFQNLPLTNAAYASFFCFQCVF